MQVSTAPTGDLTNKISGRSLTIYFDEDESTLEENDIRDIQNYLRQIKLINGIKKISIVGYTDECGSDQHNKQLGQDRANRTRSYIQQRSPYRNIQTSTTGEKHSDGHHWYQRKAVITAISETNTQSRSSSKRTAGSSRNMTLGTLIGKPLPPADFYLLDQSNSMSPYWEMFQNYKYKTPKGGKAKIYTSTMGYCNKGVDIKSIGTGGGTEIWMSYYSLIDEMPRGSSLVIISDFESNVPLSSSEYTTILNKARGKGIKVTAIYY